MIVFLVEIVMHDDLEPISIKNNYEEAEALLKGKKGIITKMILNEVYPDGICVCNHWHFGGKDNE